MKELYRFYEGLKDPDVLQTHIYYMANGLPTIFSGKYNKNVSIRIIFNVFVGVQNETT